MFTAVSTGENFLVNIWGSCMQNYLFDSRSIFYLCQGDYVFIGIS